MEGMKKISRTNRRPAGCHGLLSRDWSVWVLISLLLLLGGCLRSGKEEKAAHAEGERATVTTDSSDSIRPAPAEIDASILRERSFGEAPVLAARVQAGELPPVSDRLPKNPLVVRPLREIGRYGGDIRSALTSDLNSYYSVRWALNDNLMGYERPLPNSIQLNLAESFEFSENGHSAVFRIRQGVRWSDGMPLTADDILFYYHDFERNEDARYSPIVSHFWLVGGKPVQLEKIDDFTVRFFADKPLTRILKAVSHDHIALPKHVLAQYHPRYNPNATYEDFRHRTTEVALVLDPAIPHLSAFHPVRWNRGQNVIFERNPYYWKVDTAGNQLPYVDRLVFDVISDLNVIQLKFLSGELDLIGRYSHLASYPVLKADEGRGIYKLHFSGPGPGPVYYLNFQTPDPQLRAAIRDKRVRIALSHAINREEVNQILYHNLLEPCGFSFRRPCPYFSEEDYLRYSEYDPEKSRRLLEEAGYVDADGDGFREFEDGRRFALTLNAAMGYGYEDICEFVAEYWGEVGVKVYLNIAPPQALFPLHVTGEWEVGNQTMEATVDPLGRPHYWMIIGETFPSWYRNATDAPDWLLEATRLMTEALETFDTEVAHALMSRVREIYSENVPAIGVGSLYKVWGANVRLGNVPETTAVDDIFFGWDRSLFHEQLFIRIPD